MALLAMRIKILEGLTCDKPVITTASGRSINNYWKPSIPHP